MLVTKAGKGEDLGTEGNTPSINVEIRGLNTVNTHLLLYVPTLCLAWQLLNLNSFFWLWQFSSPCLSLSALKQKFACWSTGCRRYCAMSFKHASLAKKSLSSMSCLINRSLKWTTNTSQSYCPWLVGKSFPQRHREDVSMTLSLTLRRFTTAIHLSGTSSYETPPL